MKEILTKMIKEIPLQREKYANKHHSSLSDLDIEELAVLLG